jgi:hypothetical protein
MGAVQANHSQMLPQKGVSARADLVRGREVKASSVCASTGSDLCVVIFVRAGSASRGYALQREYPQTARSAVESPFSLSSVGAATRCHGRSRASRLSGIPSAGRR